ncbi:MAG: hypothetical protein ACLQOO_18005 [Terriglobia bacterium]
MTIAAGFKCKNGVVLCTDSQITVEGASKYPGEKIILFSGLKCRPVFAFAGYVNFSKMCIQQLAEKIEEAEHKAEETGNALNLWRLLKDECKRIWKDYEDYGVLNLIVAVKEPSLALYYIEGASVSKVDTYTCMGVGSPVATSIVELYYKPDMSISAAYRMAVYMLMQVKTFVDGCGGKSQITVFDQDVLGSSIWPMPSRDIEELEDSFLEFQSALRPVLLSYNAEEGTDDLSENLRIFSKLLRAKRKKLVLEERRLEEEQERILDLEEALPDAASE